MRLRAKVKLDLNSRLVSFSLSLSLSLLVLLLVVIVKMAPIERDYKLLFVQTLPARMHISRWHTYIYMYIHTNRSKIVSSSFM
jgi:hypothetical protein